jgi:uncharacterized protein YjeT (DUF2065 family)
MLGMTTTLPLTLYLAQMLGLYVLLVGISAFVAPQRWSQIMDGLAGSPALTLITGVFTFALGVVLIHVHYVLTDPLAIVVTVIGWIALAEGALLIVVPHLLMRVGQWSMRYIRVWAVVAIVLGILLGLAGVTGRADYTQFVSWQGFPVSG